MDELEKYIKDNKAKIIEELDKAIGIVDGEYDDDMPILEELSRLLSALIDWLEKIVCLIKKKCYICGNK